MDGKQYEKAIELAQNMEFLNPDSIQTNVILLRCLILFGHTKKAGIILKHLRTLSSSVTTEEKDLNKLVCAMKSIDQLYVDLKYEKCLADANAILETAPKSVYLRLMKAKCLIRLNDCQEAEKVIQEVMIDDPENSDAVYRLGVVRYFHGDLEESVRFIQQSLLAEPCNENRFNMLNKLTSIKNLFKQAQKLNKQQNYHEEIKIYSELINENDKHQHLLYRILKLRAYAFERVLRFKDAIVDYSKALEINNSDRILFQRAKCFLSSDNNLSCIIDCKALLSKNITGEVQQLMNSATENIKLKSITTSIDQKKYNVALASRLVFLNKCQDAKELLPIDDDEFDEIMNLKQLEKTGQVKNGTTMMFQHSKLKVKSCFETKVNFYNIAVASLIKKKNWDLAKKVVEKEIRKYQNDAAIKQKLVFYLGKIHFLCNRLTSAKKAFKSIPLTSDFHQKAIQMRVECNVSVQKRLKEIEDISNNNNEYQDRPVKRLKGEQN